MNDEKIELSEAQLDLLAEKVVDAAVKRMTGYVDKIDGAAIKRITTFVDKIDEAISQFKSKK